MAQSLIFKHQYTMVDRYPKHSFDAASNRVWDPCPNCSNAGMNYPGGYDII